MVIVMDFILVLILYDQGLLNTPKVYDFQKNNELTEGDSKFIELEVFEVKF